MRTGVFLFWNGSWNTIYMPPHILFFFTTMNVNKQLKTFYQTQFNIANNHFYNSAKVSHLVVSRTWSWWTWMWVQRLKIVSKFNPVKLFHYNTNRYLSMYACNIVIYLWCRACFHSIHIEFEVLFDWHVLLTISQRLGVKDLFFSCAFCFMHAIWQISFTPDWE